MKHAHMTVPVGHDRRAALVYRYGVSMRSTVAALVLVVVAAGCGSNDEPLTERRPDVFGWGVEYRYSDDYRFDRVDHEIAAGWMEFIMEDGTSLILNTDTELTNASCSMMAGSDEVWPPCWIHAGLSTDGYAAWVTGFGVGGRPIDDLNRNEYLPVPALADAIPEFTLRAPRQQVAYELPGEIVLVDGTVLPYSRELVDFASDVCSRGQGPELLTEHSDGSPASYVIHVDPVSGHVTALRCVVSY